MIDQRKSTFSNSNYLIHKASTFHKTKALKEAAMLYTRLTAVQKHCVARFSFLLPHN